MSNKRHKDGTDLGVSWFADFQEALIHTDACHECATRALMACVVEFYTANAIKNYEKSDKMGMLKKAGFPERLLMQAAEGAGVDEASDIINTAMDCGVQMAKDAGDGVSVGELRESGKSLLDALNDIVKNHGKD